MLLKKRRNIMVFLLVFAAFMGTIYTDVPENTAVSCQAAKTYVSVRTYNMYAGDFLYTGGIDFKVGKEKVLKRYLFHMKAGEIFKIKYTADEDELPSDFEVGLIDENGQKTSCRLKIGKHKTTKVKTLTVSEDGVYHFYFYANEANCKDGSVGYSFDIGIKKQP